jgi:hypothetical protein
VYLLVFIRNLLVHLAEKILLLQPLNFRGDYRRRIPWTDVSRLDEDEMRALMRDIVNRLYTFHLHADEPKIQATIERWMGVADKWDAPEIDPKMISSSAKPL